MGVGGVNQGAAACPLFPWPPPLLACRHKALETVRPGGSALGMTGGRRAEPRESMRLKVPWEMGTWIQRLTSGRQGVCRRLWARRGVRGADEKEEVPPPPPPACPREAAACISRPSPGLLLLKGLFGQLNSLLIYGTFR